MDTLTFNLKELIAAAVFILTGGGLGTVVAKSKGWVTFGKPVERRSCKSAAGHICDEHSVTIVEMSNINRDVQDLRSSLQSNNILLRDISSKVDRLVGYHLGQSGIDLGRSK